MNKAKLALAYSIFFLSALAFVHLKLDLSVQQTLDVAGVLLLPILVVAAIALHKRLRERDFSM